MNPRNCNTPQLCYNTLGWTPAEVLRNHDLDRSGCLDYCEWRWFYMCANVLHGWPSTSSQPNIIEKTFQKADQYDNENCCIALKELEYIIEKLGGLRQRAFPDIAEYELHEPAELAAIATAE